jgi:hypothetical protein
MDVSVVSSPFKVTYTLDVVLQRLFVMVHDETPAAIALLPRGVLAVALPGVPLVSVVESVEPPLGVEPAATARSMV